MQTVVSARRTSAMLTVVVMTLQTLPAHAGVGDQVHQTTVPISGAEQFCSIGLAFDGVRLYYDRCRDPHIYKIEPETGLLLRTINTGIDEFPNCLAYDVTRNGLWIGTQRCTAQGMPIYFLDFDDNSIAHRFTIPFGLTNPATGQSFLGFCFCDGLAFEPNNLTDPNDDELWFSDDVNRNIGVFRPNGAFVEGFDATSVNPSLSSTSGLAIGGQTLYLANNGGGDVFRADKSSSPLSFVNQFTSGDTRQEDMECDPITFAPTEVMWVRTTPQGGIFPDVITAFEIEPDTCSLGQVTPLPVLQSKAEEFLAAIAEFSAGVLIAHVLAAGCDIVGGGGLCSTATFTILSALGYSTFGLQLINIVRDPPDPDFTTIFVPRDYPPPTVSPGPDLPNDVAVLANAAFADLTNLYELVEAWRITLERYQAAILAGDETAAQMQLTALEDYISLASSAAASSANSVSGLLTALVVISGSVPITQEQLDAGRAELVANGFSPLMLQVFNNLGMSQDDIDELLTTLLSQAVTAPPSLAAIVDDMIDNLLLVSELTTPTIPTGLDIRPGDNPNSINPQNRGKIPVAILSTADFDAPIEVDEDSLTFGRIGDEISLTFCVGAEDVNDDGLMDLICHFDTQAASFQQGDTAGILMGNTIDGVPIQGGDSVRIVGQ